MTSYLSDGCRDQLRSLPKRAQVLAKKAYINWRRDRSNVGVQFKKISGPLFEARVGSEYRALALDEGDDCWLWIWIGTNAESKKLFDNPKQMKAVKGKTKSS